MQSDVLNGGIMQRSSQADTYERLANGLGWFSIGLGLAEVFRPGAVSHLIGVDDNDRNRALLRCYGLREIAAGVGILSQPEPAGWVWARVAGDVLDIGSLLSAARSEHNDRARLGTATAAVLGVTALDVICAQQLSSMQSNGAQDRDARVEKTITVNRSPEEVYGFWHDFQNLPTFMKHLDSVELSGDGRSHWRAKAPGGRTVEWDAEIVDDQPNRLIAWRSLDGSDVSHEGHVRFRPATGGRGTVVQVRMQYDPPGGVVGKTVAKLFGEEPGQQIDDDLRAFKQVIETGEVVNSDASIHPGMHAAQPPAV